MRLFGMRVAVVFKTSAVKGAHARSRDQPASQARTGDLIDQAAAMLGEKRSDFMLEAACDRAKSVLRDPAVFRLDDRRFKDFIRQLDAPPPAHEGLERLMAMKASWAEPGSKKASR
jgi:uncharacterized protein (DUF1778 family)